MLVVITGAQSGGKTELCARLAEEARRRGLPCAGILTHRETEGGARREVEDVASGERRELTAAGRSGGGPSRWQFRGDTLAWANGVLAAPLPSECLLVVDEVGPVELEMGEGLIGALDAVGKASRAACAVRSGLVEAFLDRVGSPRAFVINLDTCEASEALERASDAVFAS